MNFPAFQNTIYNRLWPLHPVHFTVSVVAAGAYHLRFPRNIISSIFPQFENIYAEWARITFVSLTSVYVPVVVVRQFLKHFYFSYKGWLFEDPKKPSVTTYIWGFCQKLLLKSPCLLKSCDVLLPSPSVPNLDETVEKYLASVKNLLTKEEYFSIKEQAEKFLKEEGRKLQSYAFLYSLFADNFITPFWEKYAYLYNRESVLINSSVAHTDLIENKPATRAFRAAHITYIEVLSHLAIDRQTFKPLGRGLLCARHYDRMYAVTRIPEEQVDYLKNYGISRHIVMLHNGILFKVQICDNENNMYSIEQLAKIFAEVIDRNEHVIDSAAKVAALTTDMRDKWARNRRRFFLENPVNRKTLQWIESAVFFLIFDDADDYGYDQDDPDIFSNFLRNMLTGNGSNRWADKSLNYIVSKNARCGGTTEHSIADGSEFDHILENFVYLDTQVLTYPTLEEQRKAEKMTDQDRNLLLAERLDLEINEEMSSEIDRCLSTYLIAMNDVDIAATIFKDFGKGLIKKCGVSPDAFVQMAIQLANYRDQGHFVLTYEAASARFYKNSRTETLRTVSDFSCAFVNAMLDSTSTNEHRVFTLKRVCSDHSRRNRECMVGKGIDRHLFVLFILSKRFGIRSPFLDNYIAQPWLLSTSHVPNCTNQVNEDNMEDSWLGACFGAVAKNGYGVCYRFAGNHSIFAHISSYKSANNTNSARFRQHFIDALKEIAALFDN